MGAVREGRIFAAACRGVQLREERQPSSPTDHGSQVTSSSLRWYLSPGLQAQVATDTEHRSKTEQAIVRSLQGAFQPRVGIGWDAQRVGKESSLASAVSSKLPRLCASLA